MDQILGLIKTQSENTSQNIGTLLTMASSNRAAIRSLVHLLANSPEVDKSGLSQILADLDEADEKILESIGSSSEP